jgi:hypothetical protein
MRLAPITFETLDDAEGWLDERRRSRDDLIRHAGSRDELIRFADTLSATSERIRALAAG